MAVDDPRRLQIGVDHRGAHEGHAPALEVFGDRVREGRGGRAVLRDGLALCPVPQPGVEAAPLLLNVQKHRRVLHRRLDFAPVADVSVVDAVLPLGGDSSKTEPTDSSLVAPVAADNGKTVANKTRPSLRDNIVVPDNRNHRRAESHDDTGLLAMSGRGGGNGRGFSVALYGSGMASFGNAPGGGSASIMPYNLMRDQVVGNDVMLLSVPFDAGDEGNEVRVKHRQPVRVGASVRFRLGGRFGLETGVNYSYHSSDISSGDDDGGYKTEQRLHFVGVPVAVSYDIWHTDYLEIYASAGGSVEFCVSGKSHTDYVQDGRVTRGIDADMRDTRPQWSVNAAVGVQYNFIDMLGVYVEPGVGYYFDNGSGVNTIYKDKPFNFNLNLGLRLTIK